MNGDRVDNLIIGTKSFVFNRQNTAKEQAIDYLGQYATALYGEDNWTVEQDGDYWTARPIKND